MKKRIIYAILLTFIFGLTIGCGSKKNDIKPIIIGEWKYELNSPGSSYFSSINYYYKFNDDNSFSFKKTLLLKNGNETTDFVLDGSYEIISDSIVLTYDNKEKSREELLETEFSLNNERDNASLVSKKNKEIYNKINSK